MRKKKIFLGLAACLVIIGVSFGITYSVLFTEETKTNEFEIGKNDIEIEEDFSAPEALTPGESFTKTVNIKNAGNIPCYVRVRVEFSDSYAEEFSDISFNIDKTDEKNDPTKLWVYREEDGYYYYKKPLPLLVEDEDGTPLEGITEQPLFESVKIKEKLDSSTDSLTAEELINFDIMVYSESCEAGTYESYEEAWGLKRGDSE